MKYFFSAGEASGDLHAAQLISALKALDPEAEFIFLGGDLMEAAAGTQPLVHYRQMAYMGFSEVIRHAGELTGYIRLAKRALTDAHPDALVLVDYPGFNLKLARYAHSLDISVYYYISPKVWAWKEHRVKQLRRYVRRIFSILPFEVEWFRRRHGYEVTYVGNPSAEEVDRKIASGTSHPDVEAIQGPYIAIVPGSRKGEIRNNLPIMLKAASQFPGYKPVVAVAPGIDKEFYTSFLPAGTTMVEGATFELMAAARAALVTSGTATLECALLGTPQVACYRSNGSRLFYNIMKRILKVSYVTLPNLIADREIIPEMLLHQCTPTAVASRLAPLLQEDSPEREAQTAGYADMRRRLGTTPAATTAAAAIIADLT